MNATASRLGALLFAAQALAAAPAGAQALRFVYMAPKASIDAAFPGAGIVDSEAPSGYSKVEITSERAAAFNANAPGHLTHLYTQLQPGTPLRTRVDQVLRISGPGGKVDVTLYLVDDRNGLPANSAAHGDIVAASPDHGTQYVWPAAFTSDPDANGRYQGYVGMGEHWGADIAGGPGGMLAWEATALHELSHTQMVGEWSKWSVSQRAITYGADENHYTEELLGDQEAAINEGTGTYFGHVHNQAERQATLTWLTDPDFRYFVEGQSVLAGEERLYKVAARREAKMGDVTVFQYRWQDVPGFFLLFSESTSTAFYTLFWLNANGDPDRAFQMINAAITSMWQSRTNRFLTYSANRLALQLEAFAATPDGARAKTDGHATSSMFPYALLDLLTHFGMTEQEYKADHDRQHPDKNPRAYTEYWAQREAVRQLLQPFLDKSPIQMTEAVQALVRYFQDPSRILTPASGS